MIQNRIIVIGASAGGVETLQQLVRALPSDFPAPILIVLHTSPHAKSMLPMILSRAGKLQSVHPENGQALEQGIIYVAPPDQHLLVERGSITLARGPAKMVIVQP